jgi:hypothetical protein
LFLGRLRIALMSVVLSAGVAACAHAPKPHGPVAAAPPSRCSSGGEQATAELVFARVANNTALGPGVSESDFSNFVSQQIVTRFHDGLTVLDAQDLSPKPAGGAVYGPAKVVMIVLPGHPDDTNQIDAIRDAYQRQFNQQSVLELTHQDCVAY